MQSVAIYSLQSAVLNMLLDYLERRSYKNISINYTNSEITAERKRSVFKKDKFHFKIVSAHATITNIEIKVNPKNENPAEYDLKKLISLAKKIYSHF